MVFLYLTAWMLAFKGKLISFLIRLNGHKWHILTHTLQKCSSLNCQNILNRIFSFCRFTTFCWDLRSRHLEPPIKTTDKKQDYDVNYVLAHVLIKSAFLSYKWLICRNGPNLNHYKMNLSVFTPYCITES